MTFAVLLLWRKTWHGSLTSSVLFGADDGTRTHDLPLTRRLLYQLSYIGKLVCEIPRKERGVSGT